MKEKTLTYKEYIYYELILDNGSKMYTTDRETLYKSKEEVKALIDSHITMK